MEPFLGGIVNFFEELGNDIENEYNAFVGKVNELLLSDLDLEIVEAERTLHGNPIGPVLDEMFLKEFFSGNLEISAEVMDDSYWPTDSKLFRSIGVDYGRSHYFFTEGSDAIAQKVHSAIFGNAAETMTDEEKLLFFNELNIDTKTTNILAVTTSVTPTRSNLITRVKFELLKRYFVEKGKAELEAQRLAIIGMGLTTQHGLRQVKSKVLDSIIPNNPDFRRKLGLQFCFFRSDFIVDQTDNEAKVYVYFVNYKPASGNWQALALIPTDNPKKISAKFVLSLEKDGDRGMVTIFFEGENPHNGQSIPREVQVLTYGIFNADANTTLAFRDTCPTW